MQFFKYFLTLFYYFLLVDQKSFFGMLKLKFAFCANNSGFDRYLFQLIVLLKADFNCGNT